MPADAAQGVRTARCHGYDAAMRIMILACLLLVACGVPAALRQGPGSGTMERTEALPMPRIVEPTGAGQITLADPSADAIALGTDIVASGRSQRREPRL
jgi:hypothetical protein